MSNRGRLAEPVSKIPSTSHALAAVARASRPALASADAQRAEVDFVPTTLDNSQRAPRKPLRALVARLFGRESTLEPKT